jgi:hypothetical protein
MGDTETYIGTLLHEAFHAYQGAAANGRLEQAEKSMGLAGRYPWDNQELEDAWKEELNQLYQAAISVTDEQAAQRAARFLGMRDQRREKGALPAELVDLERQREWEEGLAKYAELEIQRQAALTKGYRPLPALEFDPDFNSYKTRVGYWNNQLSEVKRMGNRAEDTRFYYSGFAQAVLLDKLAPGWKNQAFQPGVWLEDLLRQVVGR